MYLDCLNQSELMDEGILLSSFMSCTKRLINGAFIIILSRFEHHEWMYTKVYSNILCSGMVDECYISIFKK